MRDTAEGVRTSISRDRKPPQAFAIFTPFWLQAYGYAFAAAYGILLLRLYLAGIWLVDSDGVPRYIEFTNFWFAGLQALHGEAGSMYDPAAITTIQQTLVGEGRYVYDIWPYPPTFFFVLAPFASLPYFVSFLTWNLVTLLGCVGAVYMIVRRASVVALVLASPFTAFNLAFGQDGLLTASLLGASLLFLEKQPVVAGFFIGCLTYKPQFGILIPLALAAAKQWRAFASAAATAGLMAGASLLVFGADVWIEFPRQVFAQADEALFADPDSRWGLLQTIYGLVRACHGGAVLAWVAQGAITLGVAVLVWLVWRSPVRYTIKAATLSAAALMATPYAYAYDMAAIAIPVAFLAKDQIRFGFRPADQVTLIALFLISLSIFFSGGKGAVGAMIMPALFWLILRRAFRDRTRSGAGHVKIWRKFFEMIPSAID